MITHLKSALDRTRLLDRWTKPWLYYLEDYGAQKKLIDVHNPVIFDVGANIGQTTEKYLYYFPDSKIHAFEPFDEVARVYQSKFSDAKNVRLNKVALGEKKGKHKFFLNKCHYTNSLLPTVSVGKRVFHDNDEQLENVKSIQITTNTIDEYCESRKIAKIDILKMDVQGGELKVLKGAKKMLSSGNISLIFSEVEFVMMYQGQPLFNDISEYLDKYKYELFGIYNLSHSTNGRLLGADAVFVHKDYLLIANDEKNYN